MRQTKTPNPEYKRAFINYLRYGTDIKVPYFFDDVKTKSANKYIWRTERDSKVRVSHAENNGKVFDRDNPPATGNPKEDYNCRCKEEDYIEGVSEYANQTIISEINDAALKWTNFPEFEDNFLYAQVDHPDFLDYYFNNKNHNFIASLNSFVGHFYTGQGRNVTLREIGYLQDAINHYFYTLGKINNVNNQIIEEARKCNEDGTFTYSFNGSYDFWSIKKPLQGLLFSFGSGVVGGNFEGTVKRDQGMMKIEGKIKYYYNDEFTDLRESHWWSELRKTGWMDTSDIEAFKEVIKIIYQLGVDPDPVLLAEKLKIIKKNGGNSEAISKALKNLSKPKYESVKKDLKLIMKNPNELAKFSAKYIKKTELGGKAFKVTDNLETEFKAEAKLDRNNSIYIDNSKK